MFCWNHSSYTWVLPVRHIEQGINPPSVGKIYFSGPYLTKGFQIGVVAGLIALTEAVAIGKTFAGMKDYQLDGNKEMAALGSMNIIGSMTNCYVDPNIVNSAIRRTLHPNVALPLSGSISHDEHIVMVLHGRFPDQLSITWQYTPNAILASIIISAVLGLIDFDAVVLLWKIDKFDFLACMGAFFGVVFVSVEIGLLVAVSISFAKILLQVTRPRTAVLAVTDIDTSGINALEELHSSLQKRDVQLI
ncbi:hypothetical protein L1987_78137 [Smallanthus sonchifolius]|uniref:Uncharacterized protein n=1 Tax=Smallanthus sonchifolius TaxID=185202 RepID=A0ACB8ZBU6_9ASTR|nr:hypothetical protein L1987_78137 [Smallanthus sonchifolius]